MVFNDPRWAFNEAVGKLNAKNLYDLWTVSCVLSCVEYFDSWENNNNFLFPMLYAEKVNLLHRAILESTAAEYKKETLHAGNISSILNALIDATQRGDLLKGTDDPSARIRRLLSTMAHQQIRPQESLFLDRIGRTFAMLYDIPYKYQSRLADKMGANFLDINHVLKEYIGLTVPEFLAIGYSIIGLMKMRFDTNITISSELRTKTSIQNKEGVKLRANAIRLIVEETRNIRQNFTFRVQDIVVLGSKILTPDKIHIFLTLLSRRTKELRDFMRKNSIYSAGLIPDRLNPLERYPIIRLDNETYIVPNMRHLDMAVTDLMHYILQERFPNNEYNQLRGYIQEIYLEIYIQSRLPELTSIPETSYRRGRNRVDGPDLTVIDTQERFLIAIESKSKRIRVLSRVHPQEQYLVEDLKTTAEAFEKLPTKIHDLYARIPEYKAYQDQIDVSKDNDPISVVVLGEGVYFLAELFQDHLRNSENSFLHNYPYAYCLVRMEVFEKNVRNGYAE